MAAPPRASAAVGDCGTPLSSTTPKSSDCLFVLGAAVGSRECEACTCDVNDNGEITAADALLCLRAAVGQDVVLTCPPCAVGCPGTVEWTTRGGIGPPCNGNADCTSGSCDPGIGRCRTVSVLDLGWKGNAHRTDPGDGSRLRVLVDCEGTTEGCGECEILGIDPASGNCRCSNDTRATCGSPFAAAAAGCPACDGGARAGSACTGDAQCEGGPCATFCHFDPELPCATNSDCPAGRRLCDSQAACGNGDGPACSVDGDCDGTCTASAACHCFESPPQPVASVEFPFCMVPRLSGDVSGTIDVDTGAGVVEKDVLLVGYGGLSLPRPCPVCGGTCMAAPEEPCIDDSDCGEGDTCSVDPVDGDGIRGGTCVGGLHDGMPCDVEARNASFPANLRNGGYSLDCMPEPEADVTGPGLRAHVVEGTGEATLASNVPCDPDSSSPLACPCLTCSGSADQPCREDADCLPIRHCFDLAGRSCSGNEDCVDLDLGTCTAGGGFACSGAPDLQCTDNTDCQSVDLGACTASTCTSTGSGIAAKSNACNGGLCTADPGGTASCNAGPDDKFCDGLVRADGAGIRRCNSDGDCSAEILGFDAGACTLVEPRPCFLDPIEAGGSPDSVAPVSAATFCVAPGTNISANASLGLPGPARLVRQATLESWCASDATTAYVPGEDACP